MGKDSEVLIIFLDEENKVKSQWGEIVSKDNGLIVFESYDNRFSIPLNRLIKIKERKNG